MEAVLWLTVGVPLLVGAAVRGLPAVARPLAGAGAVLAAAPAWLLLIAAATGSDERSVLTWLPAAGLDAGLRLDGLSAVMSATVGTVGAAVLVYATGYFADDDRAPSALAGLLAFLAAMQGLVLADGYLTLLIFWELVGALSARLIAYNRADATAPAGAVRAFITTRAADAGFYLAVLALFAATGSLAFAAERPDGALGAVVGLGLVVAAMGKSAQAPLQTWLAGAMAGPTPVSALLHSATMVAAGVYLLVRSHELLAGWPLVLAGWIGALTAVLGAAVALAQHDLKRVLAGSTTSQLGLMFVGVAAGGPAVAVFHLVAHAAGKATLFLAAGIFQHDRGSTALADLRGAGRDDRAAFAAFAVGALSIAAVPPLAGFWSKDAIAAAAEDEVAWFALVLLAAAGSAGYLLRPALVLWDRAPSRSLAVRGRRVMLGGAAVLAGASVVLGLAGEPLADLLGAEPLPASALSVALSLLAVAAGAVAVLRPPRLPAGVVEAARRQLFANEALRAVVERPVLRAARRLDVVDRRAVDGVVHALARATRATSSGVAAVDTHAVDAAVDGVGRARLASAGAPRWVEERGVDAAVDGLAQLVGAGGRQSRRLESGRLHEYLRDTVLGACAVAGLIALAALL
jgi:NADH-quinone oxidoreductase subunit L